MHARTLAPPGGHAIRTMEETRRRLSYPRTRRTIVPGTFIPCSIVLHFGVGARPFRDMPLYSKGRSTSVAARGRLA
jgi:hypothetical protein